LKGKGEKIVKEGRSPSLNPRYYGEPAPSSTPLKSEESQREALPLLKYYFPLPFLREGGQGDGFLKIYKYIWKIMSSYAVFS
jgi:hypothetical protein